MLPGVQRIVHDVFGTDDRAASRSTFVGTTADGRVVELPIAGVVHAANGLIVESWLYLDPSALI